MRIEIDRTLCIGAGECEFLAPSVFHVRDDGVAHLLEPASVDRETLLTAERSCPSGAIRVIVEDRMRPAREGGQAVQPAAE